MTRTKHDRNDRYAMARADQRPIVVVVVVVDLTKF